MRILNWIITQYLSFLIPVSKATFTASISHIHREQNIITKTIITKTIHHMINITFTKAELFVIRYDINHATQIQDVTHIVIIMDAILAVKHIFDMTIHPYQLYSIILNDPLTRILTIQSYSGTV